MIGAYYNEIDPKAAAWLRELIKQGHIADGVVDERSIVDVKPEEIREFTQCHFFAGIGVWSYALRRAGWEDGRPVWTGSCPCQPFSAAGKGNGFADERHLWPAFFHLIENVRPVTVFGEQVASKDGLGWLDLVQADLEGKDYAFGSIDTCAAGFGAPHIRQRLYWVADAAMRGRKPEPNIIASGIQQEVLQQAAIGQQPCDMGAASSDLANTLGAGLQGHGGLVEKPVSQGRQGEERYSAASCGVGGMGISDSAGSQQGRKGSEAARYRRSIEPTSSSIRMGDPVDQSCERKTGGILGTKAQKHGERVAINGGMPIGFEHAGEGVGRPASSPTNGFWRDADWLFCRDGKWRPVEPSTFPLAYGASARVGRLRGYGNAINAAQAEGFITAFMEEVA